MSIELNGSIGTLGGTAEVPAGCGPHPVVLIVSGSGTTDRDGLAYGEGPANYRALAYALRDLGIASVRYDDHGIGASADALPRRTEDHRFDTEVTDAAAWARKLRHDPRFGRLIVAGHSQGALVGTLVAQTESIDGLVTIGGTSLPAGRLLIEQIGSSASTTPTERSALEHAVAELEAGRVLTEALPPRLESVLPRELQPYLISWFRFDPVEELTRLSADVLVIHGENDKLVPPAQATMLAHAREGLEPTLIARMAHSMKEADTDAASQRAASSDPDVPLAEGLAETLADFARGD